MNTRTRFVKTFKFESVDRLPITEWAFWWNETIDRWRKEGLPLGLEDPSDIRDYFGLDAHRHFWFRSVKPNSLELPADGTGIVKDMDSYLKIKPFLFPDHPYSEEMMRNWANLHARGETAVWITFEGFFWVPRTLLGIEGHLYAFVDAPEVIHAINQDLADYHIRMLEQLGKLYLKPDFMSFAEDLSYNNGVMISKKHFDTFMAPYYKQVVPKLAEHNVIPFIDSDGQIEELIPWMMEVGIEGILPLERQAGVDIVELRRKFPKLKMIGGYDKMVMSRTEVDMRAEFDRILPVMKQGGYLPSVDHQTPPGVSLHNYSIYVKLLNEYCRKAVQ